MHSEHRPVSLPDAHPEHPPLPELPYDFPLAAQHGSDTALCRRALPVPVAAALAAQAAAGNRPLPALLLSGLMLLLARMTGQSRLAVATHGRLGQDRGGPLLIACEIDMAAPLAPLQDRLAQELRDAPAVDADWTGTTAVAFDMTGQVGAPAAPAYGLHFLISQGDVDWQLACRYRTACFKQTTVDYLLAQYAALLGDMAAHPERCAATFALFPPDATAGQQAFPLAAPTDDFDIEQSIPDRFAQQVARFPDQIAVKTARRSLTYRELDLAARTLAATIVRRTGRSNERVALLFEHDVPMIVGLLGALIAGKTYVPLDAGYPEARLRFMLEDAQAELLVSNNRNMKLALALADGAVPVVNVDFADRAQSTALAAHGLTQPDDMAYILYTSGSTGRPKGVMQNHRNVLYFARNYARNLAIVPADRLTVLASYSFDAAAMDIFGALLNGGTLYPIDPRTLSREELLARMEQEGISIFHSTPTLYRHLFGGEGARVPASSRALVLGGELVKPADVQIFNRAGHAGCVLVNGYGPTESTLALQNYLRHGDAVPTNGVSAGHAVAGTDVVLADAWPPRAFQRGEVIIRSPHVALGYWNRPELTARAFGIDDLGRRYYRTGDLGVCQIDGSIVIRGRIDHQVKIRGYRIEPGEIEAALTQLEGVDAALVMVREDGGEAQLVAYIVQRREARGEATVQALRQALLLRLPDYMVPGAYVMLDAFPVNPNGKVDRLALPAPQLDGAAVATPPVTATERALAEIWSTLLPRDRIGSNEDFFAIGGHSLLAMQLMSRIREVFKLELPLAAVFEAPTIAQLAQRIDGIGGDADRPQLSPVVAMPRSGPVPTSYSQHRLWFLDQLDAAAGLSYNMAAGMRLVGRLDMDALQRSLDRIVFRHENLRTTFTVCGEHPFQRIAAPDSGFPLAIRDLTHLPANAQDAAVRRAADAAATRPFDLARGPLLRGELLRLSADRHVVFIAMHHIVSDGWSVALFMRELVTLYTAFRAGKADPLPPLPVQYADYTMWQLGWLQGQVLQAHLDFWTAHLRGAAPLLALPLDRPRPAAQRYCGSEYAFRLSAGLTAAIHAFSRRHGATLFMSLFAAWAAQLSGMSGATDIVVGTPVANRRHTNVEGLIGFFVNTLALRVQATPELTVAQWIAQVKQTASGAYAHQELPFDRVVRALQPPRSMAYSPVFQVMLSLDNMPREEAVTLPDLVLQPVAMDRPSTHYDLSLSFSESGGTLQGSLTYATELFDRGRIERMAQDFEQLIGAMVADDLQSLDALLSILRDCPAAPATCTPALMEERAW